MKNMQMKKILIKALIAAAIMTNSSMTYAQTIFSKPFNTVHGTAPFSKIDDSQWMPAIDAGIEQAKAEVEAIATPVSYTHLRAHETGT